MHGEGPLQLSLGTEPKVMSEVVHALCALMWVRPADNPLLLSLRSAPGAEQSSGSFLGAAGLATLCKAMTPTLASLDLEDSSCANQAGDNPEGVLRLCDALSDARLGGGLARLKCTLRFRLATLALGSTVSHGR